MRFIGTLLIIVGIISAAMYLFKYQLSVLSWMNEMPETQQWLIRGGLVVVGLIFLLLGRKRS